MTGFIVATVLSAALLAVAIVFAVCVAKRSSRPSRIITPSRVLAVGVFFAGWVLFFPHYFTEFSVQPLFPRLWESFWVSAHHSVRLFIIDTDFGEIFASATAQGLDAYAVFGTVLLILAPIMTAGVILSFFDNFMSYVRCFLHRSSGAYVFSELNEKSLALATDLQRSHKKALFIFADVFQEENEEKYEFREKARELGAVCFRHDIATLNFRFFKRSSMLYFIIMGENEDENIKQATSLCAPSGPYAHRPNVHVDVFVSEAEEALLLGNLPKTNITLRCVDVARLLALHNLDDLGVRLFENAVPTDEGNKRITALVIGTGKRGMEMIKTLSWYGQMEGYRLEIHAFDADPHAEDRFTLQAPELMSPNNNGVYIPGEAQYKIVFHDGISVEDARFTRALDTVDTSTFIFVCLGDDAKNLRTAVYLRQYWRRRRIPDPIIQAILYDRKNQEILNEARNWKGQAFGIEFIDSLEEVYSEKVILCLEREKDALFAHTRYGGDLSDFYRYSYNYNSSVASAFHRELRRKLKIAGFETWEDVNDKDRELVERIEHRRWNAYMRAEGYVYSGSPDRASRDDLAKMHHNLIPFDELSEEDKRKDSIVGIGK